MVVSGRRAEVLEELAAGLGGDTTVLDADLADAEPLALVERAGPLDVLVANAALPASGRVDSFTPEEIDRALDVNLRAPMQLARALQPGMVERGRGHMVFVSSLSGKVSAGGSAIYSATKFGLRGFAVGLREDLHRERRGRDDRVPGFISDAGMFAETGMKLPPGVGTRTPEAVADAVVRGIEPGRPSSTWRRSACASARASGASRRRRWAPCSGGMGSLKVADQLAAGQRSKR